MENPNIHQRLNASWALIESEDKAKFGEWWLHPDRAVMDFATILKEHGMKRILDMGCGMGRHTVALAQGRLRSDGIRWFRICSELHQ